MNKKKIYLSIGIVVLSLAILGSVFYGGIELGKKYYPSINLIKGLENKETGKSADIDFSLFWDAWRIIQSNYLKSDDLDKKEMVYGAIRGLLNSLDDPHSVFFDPEEAKRFSEDANGSFSGVGMEISIKNQILTVISPLEDTPAWNAGIKAGDQILEIDGESTYNIQLFEAVNLIRGEKGTDVILKILRKSFDKPKDFVITRDTIFVPATKLSFLNDNIAHLKLLSFSENAPYDFYKSAIDILNKNSSGIILDLRNNPGGYLEIAIHLAGWFVERGDVVVRENIKGKDEEVIKASGNEVFVDMPIVILINEGSASASEILAGALRDNRGIQLIGEKTFGKGSVQTIKELFDDSMVKITIAEWLTPNGLSIDEDGLVPDYEISLPDDYQEEDEDIQLNKAIEILKSLK
jgi:carboxyl-terminal processing protease